MSTVKQQTMQVRIDGELVERGIASITRSIKEDGSVMEYPEPLLAANEVVFRPDANPAPIIVQRTIPA